MLSNDVFYHKLQSMDIENFRSDFLAKQAETGMGQSRISAVYGVQQAALSRFASKKMGLSFKSIIKLWPFVYGCEFSPASTMREDGGGGDE